MEPLSLTRQARIRLQRYRKDLGSLLVRVLAIPSTGPE